MPHKSGSVPHETIHMNLALLLLAWYGALPGAVVAHAGTDSALRAAVRFFVGDFLPSGGACTRGGPYHYPKCGLGLWCIGKTSPRRERRVKVGGKCGSEDQLCELRSCCQGVKCRAIARMPQNYLPKFAACALGGLHCFPGLWCIVGRCRRLVPCGGVCGTPTTKAVSAFVPSSAISG